MTTFQTLAILITLAACASYLNHRFLRFPDTIGLMAIALGMSVLLLIGGEVGFVPIKTISGFVSSINFSETLLHGMLAFLLFAGALHIDLEDLRQSKTPIALLATIGVVIATAVTGLLFWGGVRLMGFEISLMYALLFGALIAPTDPIAVLGIIKTVGVPKQLEVTITAESLFNDGVAVVVFLTLLAVASGQDDVTGPAVGWYFLKETIGGSLLGYGLGWLFFHLLKSIDAYHVEVLLTLSLASGGYALAEWGHVSAPIAIVVAGLLIGNHGRSHAMSHITREHLDTFWELVDQILNAVLFLLIGLELIAIPLKWWQFGIGLMTIFTVLAGRVIGVALPVSALRQRYEFLPGTIPILTWGGLRGGISIAMVLSLPATVEKELLLVVTYVVVVFSVLVQGLTFGKFMRTVLKPANQAASEEASNAGNLSA
ncbi:MAG: sodium:proton antiporter [Blastocatellia bacterium]|nr:sodium:proton antiporter [Blastocatellia bacterium]